ncbi:unnamed protein product, partial [Polarella glacialis]
VIAVSASFAHALPATPHWFDQKVDHFSTSGATFKQRYYVHTEHFGGPGSPIFVIMGGEGGIPPEVGFYYPWVVEVLAKKFQALVLEPEHRFYGASLPWGEDSFTQERLQVMNTQQALADTAHFIRSQQGDFNCTKRGTAGYCPVHTIGGSYPGFLSAMMRLRYPAVVDSAHAASAPIRFYAQQVDQYAYYTKVTESAERSFAGCPHAVLSAFLTMEAYMRNATADDIAQHFSLCTPLPEGRAAGKDQLADNLLFLAEQTFANLNMANYPPDNKTGLYKACASFVAAASQGGQEGALDAMRSLLLSTSLSSSSKLASGRAYFQTAVAAERPLGESCFNLQKQLPAGQSATARCGDWSGCGAGHDGEMWDYQTCTFEVEQIGFGSAAQMFPTRRWSKEWLQNHCRQRFGVSPQPLALAELWGLE